MQEGGWVTIPRECGYEEEEVIDSWRNVASFRSTSNEFFGGGSEDFLARKS